MNRFVEPPADEQALVCRAQALSGLTLGELGAQLGLSVPADLKRDKGWVGQAMERALGATAKSKAIPDFPGLGVELKTLPVDERGRPLESTFVCTIPLNDIADVEWSESRVRGKLSRVLWVPVDGTRERPVHQRRIATALIWSPTSEQEALLRSDWTELATLIARGDYEAITGHLGTLLQVRPKAANSRARRIARDEDGGVMHTLPRGFYLRAKFTASILREHFRLPE